MWKDAWFCSVSTYTGKGTQGQFTLGTNRSRSKSKAMNLVLKLKKSVNSWYTTTLMVVNCKGHVGDGLPLGNHCSSNVLGLQTHKCAGGWWHAAHCPVIHMQHVDLQGMFWNVWPWPLVKYFQYLYKMGMHSSEACISKKRSFKHRHDNCYSFDVGKLIRCPQRQMGQGKTNQQYWVGANLYIHSCFTYSSSQTSTLAAIYLHLFPGYSTDLHRSFSDKAQEQCLVNCTAQCHTGITLKFII